MPAKRARAHSHLFLHARDPGPRPRANRAEKTLPQMGKFFQHKMAHCRYYDVTRFNKQKTNGRRTKRLRGMSKNCLFGLSWNI